MTIQRTSFIAMVTVLSAACLAGCGDDSATTGSGTTSSSGTGVDRPEETGAKCDSADDCYPNADPMDLHGAAQCIDKIPEGYCTHACEADADCCAAEGECKTDIGQVCSPFENLDGKMCFLSCEDEDLRDKDGNPGDVDAQEYCQREAGTSFFCRSSGGGNQNRKICVPGECGGDGSRCNDNSQCNDGRTCFAGFDGGYCAKVDCNSDNDCSDDAACVKLGTQNICLKRCNSDGDCTYCRASSTDASTACRTDVEFVGSTTAESVCAPPS